MDWKDLFKRDRDYLSTIPGPSRGKSMYETIRDAEPTDLHKFLDIIAFSGRLQRVYTQNIDNLERRLQFLTGRTVQLAGRLDQMICDQCSHQTNLKPDLLQTRCPQCRDPGRTSRTAGYFVPAIGLRPDEEEEGDEQNQSQYNTELLQAISVDQDQKPDAIIVIGISIRGSMTQVSDMFEALCQSMDPNGVAVWINKMSPPPAFTTIADWSLNLRSDCAFECFFPSTRTPKHATRKRRNSQAFDKKDAEMNSNKVRKATSLNHPGVAYSDFCYYDTLLSEILINQVCDLH